MKAIAFPRSGHKLSLGSADRTLRKNSLKYLQTDRSVSIYWWQAGV